MNIEQLTINVNLHCLQPNFLNYELYYIIAVNENTFRFVSCDDEPAAGEEKYYCYLQDEDLYIPAGDMVLKQSYVLSQQAPYPEVRHAEDLVNILNTLTETRVAKAIRCFTNDQVDSIKHTLEKHFGAAEKHLVTSPEAQHQLIVVNDVEISISVTMIYFRYRIPITEEHYDRIKQEEKEHSRL